MCAREAPTVVVLQRWRAKRFHVLTIDARRLTVTHGSWFDGRLYPERCDVSFDGRYMVYFAIGADGRSIWNGVCELPWLKTVAESPVDATWGGGGRFESATVLRTNGWTPEGDVSRLPFAFVALPSQPGTVRRGGASDSARDCLGNLWVAGPGVVERYTLKDEKAGTPSWTLDVDAEAETTSQS